MDDFESFRNQATPEDMIPEGIHDDPVAQITQEKPPFKQSVQFDQDGNPGRKAWGSISRDRNDTFRGESFLEDGHKKNRSGFSILSGGLWQTRQMTDKSDREVYVRTTLRELVVYLIFLAVFCTTTYSQMNHRMYYNTNALSDLFLNQPYMDTRNTLKGSTQVMDFWRFAQNIFINGTYLEKWYDKTETPIAHEDRNVLLEHHRVGVARLRQLRVTNQSCDIPEKFQRSIRMCFASYSHHNEDKLPYGPKTSPEFTYSSQEELGSMPSWGKIATYSGGGFISEIGTTKNEATLKLEYLKKHLWIDRATRVVFFDFTVYNANLNYFCVVKITIEFPATGGIIPSWSFRTIKLVRYLTPFDYVVMACELVFLFFIGYYIIEEILEIKALGKAYFKSMWNILDLVVIALSLIIIGYNIYNYLTIDAKLEKLLEYPDKYANFEYLGYWEVQLNAVIAVCVFFSWFKLFKYISFNKTMTQLTSTLSRCAKDVAGFAIMFFIVFFAFSQLGYLLFGTQVYDFHTFIDSAFTLLRTILGDFNFREIEQANRILGPIYFLAYVFFVFFVLLNMFLAIINDTYSEVKDELAHQRNEFELKDFFKRGYANALSKFDRRDKIFEIESQILKSQDKDGFIEFDTARDCLKQCFFSELEIESFFAKYNLSIEDRVDAKEMQMMLRDLENQQTELEDRYLQKGPHSPSRRPMSSRSRSARSRLGSTASVVSGISEEEFERISQKMEQIEESSNYIFTKFSTVQMKMDEYERSRNRKKQAMGEFIDELFEPY